MPNPRCRGCLSLSQLPSSSWPSSGQNDVGYVNVLRLDAHQLLPAVVFILAEYNMWSIAECVYVVVLCHTQRVNSPVGYNKQLWILKLHPTLYALWFCFLPLTTFRTSPLSSPMSTRHVCRGVHPSIVMLGLFVLWRSIQSSLLSTHLPETLQCNCIDSTNETSN
jgi:hypothetical protein